MTRTALLFVALALAALPALAINKCVGKDGKVSYQEGKCPDDSKQDVLKAPVAATPGAAPKADAKGPAEPAVVLQLASDQVTLETCDTASPGFVARYRTDIEAWRAFNAAKLARYEDTPEYRQILENGRKQFRDNWARDPVALEKLGRFCHGQFMPAFRRTFGK